jgi:hypothetical protein
MNQAYFELPKIIVLVKFQTQIASNFGAKSLLDAEFMKSVFNKRYMIKRIVCRLDQTGAN